MERLMCMVVVVGVVAAVMLQCVAAQRAYVVGDSLGWAIPPNGAAAYTTWASNKKFMVGDILIFNFGTNQHDVQQVPKDSYDACSSTNAIGNPITNGPANITLDSPGDHYYICTFGRHCQAGQKLAITASATPGATPPSTSTPTPPGTPSPTSNTPAACAPTPSSSPTAGGPTASTTPETRVTIPDSSAPALFSCLFLTLLSIAMALSL